jgi:hypothetical protein
MPGSDLYHRRAGVARILQQVHQNLLHFIAPGSPKGVRFGRESHRASLLRQTVELHHLFYGCTKIDLLQRLVLERRGGEPAEGAGDGVEPVDLRQDAISRLIQGPVELGPAVAVHSTKVLHTQPHRRERIFDLVRHLACHLTPGQDPLGPGHLRHIIQREHCPSELGTKRGQLQRNPAAPHIQLD